MPQLFKLDHQPTNQQTTSGAQFLHSSLPPKKGELKISDDRRRSDHKDYCNLSDPGSLFIFTFLFVAEMGINQSYDDVICF